MSLALMSLNMVIMYFFESTLTRQFRLSYLDSNPSLVEFLGVLKIERVPASFLYSIVQEPASIAEA